MERAATGRPIARVNENQLLTLTATATDPDAGSALTFSAGNLPTGATLNATTDTFAWTPTTAQAGTATDNGSRALTSAPVIFTITVNAVGTPPPTAGGVLNIKRAERHERSESEDLTPLADFTGA